MTRPGRPPIQAASRAIQSLPKYFQYAEKPPYRMMKYAVECEDGDVVTFWVLSVVAAGGDDA